VKRVVASDCRMQDLSLEKWRSSLSATNFG
jgi:hypothetical protein